MRPWLACSALALTLTAAAPARAAIGALDVTPAATLFIPYFEVDLAAPNGRNTVVAMQANTDGAVLTNVTLWSDLGVPVLRFNVYLTGYDVQTFSLRDVLAGNLPQTGSAGQDPMDTISHKGPQSQDIGYASCTGMLPPAMLSASDVTDLRAALTGQAVAGKGGQCAGLGRGDMLARGYITIDTVNQCSTSYPSDSGYFVNGGAGIATVQNVLLGDFFLIDGDAGLSRAENAVHLEADATHPETSVAGQYTFYGRFVGYSAADNREPVGSVWEARYADVSSDLIVWRDPKVASPSYFACDGKPAWYPLGQRYAVVFDSQENPISVEPGATPFPAALNRVNVGGTSLPTMAKEGFVFLDLNTTVSGVMGPPEDPTNAQSYVLGVINPETIPGTPAVFTAATSATPLELAWKTFHTNYF